jgi:hypothetical protein
MHMVTALSLIVAAVVTAGTAPAGHALIAAVLIKTAGY